MRGARACGWGACVCGRQSVDSYTDTISLAVVDIGQWAAFDEKHTLMVDALSDELDESSQFFNAISAARNAALEMMPGTGETLTLSPYLNPNPTRTQPQP